MNIPGSNLLNLAARALRFEKMPLRAFVSRAINDAGNFVSTYAAPVDFWGSMQPVNKKLYQELGLNLTKKYQMLYTSADVKSTDVDREGDLVTYAGLTWLCESDQDWRPADGYRKILCVQVPAP